MGWSEAEVAASSLWRFTQAWAGWRKANGAEDKPAAPTDEEFEAAVRNLR